ncbi:MAG: hypothetical protein IPM47_10190 [Sphingobacteriales bacterium]|nr:MAG: hypothetical protein IPM47_10190 [Sphingobacteriales bacterium]
MTHFQKYKSLYVFLAWMLSGIAFSVMLMKARYAYSLMNCTGIEVKIDESEGTRFVDDAGVRKLIISKMPNSNSNALINQINLQVIEDYLQMNPHIENAELYFDYNGKMWAEIKQRTPLLRVVNSNNISYYISTDGLKMPVSEDFTARVTMATGNIRDNNKTEGEIDAPIVKQLFSLCIFLKQNEFLNSLAEQIFVNSNGDMVIIPKIGKHKVVIGNAENLEDKFNKLQIFYREAMPHVGWNTYETINLKFANQIVCTKR